MTSSEKERVLWNAFGNYLDTNVCLADYFVAHENLVKW